MLDAGCAWVFEDESARDEMRDIYLFDDESGYGGWGLMKL
jgi:hypothetical protein